MWSWKAADFPLCCNSIGFPETQSTCNKNSNNNNNKNLRKKKGQYDLYRRKCTGLILILFPTYLIQLPVLSFYLLSSLTLTCCSEFPSSSCPSSYHHLSPEQLCLHPTWSSQIHTGSIQHLTPQGTACHALTLLWWENIDSSSWLSEMGPQMLHNLGSVIFNVTVASCNTRLAVFCIQPHWPFKTHTGWYVFHKQIISFT